MKHRNHFEGMNMKQEGHGVNEGYSTTDLNLAAFLMARGLPLLRTESAGGFRKTFWFSPEARGLAAEFYQNAPVPARSFTNALRDLKALALTT